MTAPTRTGQLVQSVADTFRKQKDCGPSGWYGEETLDVEAVHAMAPGARIVYYGAASCYDDDLLDSLANVVDDNLASLVTNSWGDVEESATADNINAYEQVFLQGAMQGQAFLFSSGDDGDELASTGIKQADYPTSDPYVTSVGGTRDAIGPDAKFEFQTGWGTDKYTLSSDATSWTPLGFLARRRRRAVRRCSTGRRTRTAWCRARTARCLTSDWTPTRPRACWSGETQTFSDGKYYDEYRLGGTSLASPLFAGMTALRTQKAGVRLGS